MEGSKGNPPSPSLPLKKGILMGRYRKIDSKMWGDEKFASLSKSKPNGQTLWIFLLTGPHANSCPGLYAVGERALAEALGWQLKDFRRAFKEISMVGMAKADWEKRVILIPNVIKYDPPQNPNIIKKWGKDFDEIPECSLKREYYSIIKNFLKDFPEGFQKAFREYFGNDLKNDLKNDSLNDSINDSSIPYPKPYPKPKPYSESIDPDSVEMKISSLLLSLIRKNKPDFRDPDLQKWSNEIDLMIQKEKRDPERIEKVIRWATNDEFWKTNILSTKKLRQQFDTLEIKMEAQKKRNEIIGDDPIDRRARLIFRRKGSSNHEET